MENEYKQLMDQAQVCRSVAKSHLRMCLILGQREDNAEAVRAWARDGKDAVLLAQSLESKASQLLEMLEETEIILLAA